MRMLMGFAAGFAGGYALSRAIEARAANVPLNRAFRLDNILTPISRLSMVEALQAKPAKPVATAKWDPDALVTPSGGW